MSDSNTVVPACPAACTAGHRLLGVQLVLSCRLAGLQAPVRGEGEHLEVMRVERHAIGAACELQRSRAECTSNEGSACPTDCALCACCRRHPSRMHSPPLVAWRMQLVNACLT